MQNEFRVSSNSAFRPFTRPLVAGNLQQAAPVISTAAAQPATEDRFEKSASQGTTGKREPEIPESGLPYKKRSRYLAECLAAENQPAEAAQPAAEAAQPADNLRQLKQAIHAYAKENIDQSKAQELISLIEQWPQAQSETLSKMASSNLPDKKYGLIHEAAQRGDQAVLKCLLSKGVNPDALDKAYKCSALLYAAEQGHNPIIRTLLNAGASINLQDKQGMTALHYAADQQQDETVALLLEEGANPNQVNKQGCTALHYATEHWATSIVKQLLKKNADPNLMDQDERSALDYALDADHAEILELFTRHAEKKSKK